MEQSKKTSWPVLRYYDQEHSCRIALPVGGIGTGTVSLGGRGDLRDWEIVNRPAKGFAPTHAFFALRTATAGGQPVAKALEGRIPTELYEGWSGSPVFNAGMPRFQQHSFETTYPFGRVVLKDSEMPVDVTLEAFNPLIPCDADASGIPLAVFRFNLLNNTSQEISAAICGVLQNFIGQDGSLGKSVRNRNRFRAESGLQGMILSSDGVDPKAEQWGTLALTTTAKGPASFRTSWADLSWGNTLLDFWDDFLADGRLDDRVAPNNNAPIASLAVPVQVPPDGGASITFLLTWHFPNRLSWRAPERNPQTWSEDLELIGNYYTTQYTDAWDVAEKTLPQLEHLELQTTKFAASLYGSELPDKVKEAALFNVSTLRTQTCFRTPDGYLFGWEGCQDVFGSCFGSCTHVWNYEQATAYLFGDLAKGMREVECLHATDSRGLMSFRVNLPLVHGHQFGVAAADGQMGCIIKAYRDWSLSGDEDFLRKIWPGLRRALEFCWIRDGWDGDQDGVMEGCQHNTMDVEYYGPNPQMGFLYLGALRAAEEMARYLGEKAFAQTCADLFAKGSDWLDEHLFNGDYYEHQVIPPKDGAVAPGLAWNLGAKDPRNPDLQLASGCLVDQLFGQFLAHVCHLGYLSDKQNIRKSLQSILRFNYKEDFSDHFNHMRSYVLNDEAALVMASYPRGGRPQRPFPYFNEVMTGFEYTAAIGMIYEGDIEAGLKCIESIRNRYDGKKRSPFNEAECGHHYARAMASWAAILALTGFGYSAVQRHLWIKPTPSASQTFWSNGYAWGSLSQTPSSEGTSVEVVVHSGAMKLRRISLVDFGAVDLPEANLRAGEHIRALIQKTA